MSNLETLLNQSLANIATASNISALEQLRVSLLGKKGEITQQLKQLGGLPPEERKAFGESINRVKDALQNAISEREEFLKEFELNQKLASESIDVTLSGRTSFKGGLHPVTQTLQRIEQLFAQIGFTVAEGPEVENDYHNFEALNIPQSHPARCINDLCLRGNLNVLPYGFDFVILN